MSTPPPVAPDMADRVAQMVAAERATLNALVTEPEIEIVGVASAMGAGAMGSAAADEWSLRLSLLRWREVQGTRQGGELRMCMLTNEAEVDRIVELIPGPTAVRMRVRLIVPPASPLDMRRWWPSQRSSLPTTQHSWRPSILPRRRRLPKPRP